MGAQTWPGLMLILVVLVGRKWLRFPVRKVSSELVVVLVVVVTTPCLSND